MDKQKNKFTILEIALFIALIIELIIVPIFCISECSKNNVISNSDFITENVDVQRSIKKANNDANPIIAGETYSIIYLNNTLSAEDMCDALIFLVGNFSNAFLPLGNNIYVYPIYAYQENNDSNVSIIFIMYSYELRDSITIRSFSFIKGYLDFTILGMYGTVAETSTLSDYDYQYNISIANYITPSNGFKTITPLSSVSFAGNTVPVGTLNTYITSIVSAVPFVFECPSVPSGPSYEIAPSSLVNDIPLNVQYPSSNNNNKSVSPVLSYPSISSKYYGSIFGNPVSVGSQNQTLYDYKADLYINSSLRPKQNVFGFGDFISYYDTYDYLFTGFDIVLQTMWGQVPIYYKITTNDFGFAYDVSRLLNESNTIEDYFNLSITSDIEERFLDFVHINIQFYFNADTNYDSKYFNVNEEYELEGLIPNTYYNGEYLQAEFGSVRYDADSFITNDEIVANGAYQTLRNYRIASSNVLNRLEQAYSDEYEQGYNEGYSAGVVDAGGENTLGPVFAWLVSASSVIANIFSIEIFPYITLGMLLLFPLVVFIIVWILKLFFGG